VRQGLPELRAPGFIQALCSSASTVRDREGVGRADAFQRTKGVVWRTRRLPAATLFPASPASFLPDSRARPILTAQPRPRPGARAALPQRQREQRMRATGCAEEHAGKCSSSGTRMGFPNRRTSGCGASVGQSPGWALGKESVLPLPGCGVRSWGPGHSCVCSWGKSLAGHRLQETAVTSQGRAHCSCLRGRHRCTANAGPGDPMGALSVNAQSDITHKQKYRCLQSRKCSQATNYEDSDAEPISDGSVGQGPSALAYRQSQKDLGTEPAERSGCYSLRHKKCCQDNTARRKEGPVQRPRDR
jgi:hypothetical protein